MHKAKQRACHKKQQRRVRHRSLAHIHDHNRGAHDQTGPEPCPGAKLPGSGNRCHQNRADSHQGRRQTGGQFGKTAEQFQRAYQQPVKNRRLVIPVFIVNTGGKIFVKTDHFLGRFRVYRFVRVQQRHPVYTEQNIKAYNNQ